MSVYREPAAGMPTVEEVKASEARSVLATKAPRSARGKPSGLSDDEVIGRVMVHALEGTGLRAVTLVSSYTDEIIVRIYAGTKLRHEERISGKSLAAWRYDRRAMGKRILEIVKASEDADRYAEMFE